MNSYLFFFKMNLIILNYAILLFEIQTRNQKRTSFMLTSNNQENSIINNEIFDLKRFKILLAPGYQKTCRVKFLIS